MKIENDMLIKLLDNLNTAVICTDENLQINYVNSTAEALLFTSKTKLLNHHLRHFLPLSLPKMNDLITRTINKHQTFLMHNIELENAYHKSLVDFSVSPLVVENNHYLVFELNGKDRQTWLEKEDEKARQYAMTRQLIRGVAHEIKNPLAGIRGAAQLLKREVTDFTKNPINHKASEKSAAFASDANEFIEVIIQESDRLKLLANNMLGSNKLPNITLVNIHEPLHHVLKLLQPQFPSIKISQDYDTSLPEIFCDKDKLIQVFLNIGMNAAQALTENHVTNPKICFKTRIENDFVLPTSSNSFKKLVEQERVNLYKKSNQTDTAKKPQLKEKTNKLMRISIIDNGLGIDDHVKSTLFYPMVTNRANGTGLGLAIAQDIIRHHDGIIECQSKPGHTAFDIYLSLNVC